MRIGRFSFHKDAIEYGNDLILNDPSEIVMLDEIGKFEVDGFVWADLLKQLFDRNDLLLIITVRDTFVELVKNHFNLKETRIIPCRTPVDVMMNQVLEVID